LDHYIDPNGIISLPFYYKSEQMVFCRVLCLSFDNQILFMKRIIRTSEAPLPIGPYSQAVQSNGLLFVSGQIAIDPETQTYTPGSAAEEAKQVMKNLHTILAAADLSFEHVLKTTIFLIDMADFAAVNAVYSAHFPSDFPARETVQVAGLPANARVEISVVAGDK